GGHGLRVSLASARAGRGRLAEPYRFGLRAYDVPERTAEILSDFHIYRRRQRRSALIERRQRGPIGRRHGPELGKPDA
ncbi:hypothetical protein ACI3PL_32135, partial [Lacticaseibacillus paracasei]